ncbi:hypothetical protein ACT7CU_11065 [Bacillus paranthracis]
MYSTAEGFLGKFQKEPLIVQRGGAPIRLQRLNEENPLREKSYRNTEWEN